MIGRFAICNEMFEGWDHGRVCRFVAEVGYEGLEIAPFTLAPLITELTAARRTELRTQAQAVGLTIVGLHWLLAKTTGLHLTSADAATRRRTSAYLADLARCCGELGGSVMVLGSPHQRRRAPGMTTNEADGYAAEVITPILPVLETTGVRLCLEPLAADETDYWNTCADVSAFVERVGHPNVCLHLDVKAMASEAVAITELIRRHATSAGHFHANDPNRRGPGFGSLDFRPVLAALSDARYGGWVSVEVFEFTPDAETIARECLRYLRQCAENARCHARP